MFFGDGDPRNLSETFVPPPRVTNQTMEIMACIRALELLGTASSLPVLLVSDSRYVVNSMTVWVKTWERNAWKTRFGHPVANRELLQRLRELSTRHRASFKHVAGHGRRPDTRDLTSPEYVEWYGNAQADALATAASARAIQPPLDKWVVVRDV